MTKSQSKIVNELRNAFDNAETFNVVASEFSKKAKVFMSFVTRDCKNRFNNEFEVGPRGGLRVIKQEFTAND